MVNRVVIIAHEDPLQEHLWLTLSSVDGLDKATSAKPREWAIHQVQYPSSSTICILEHDTNPLFLPVWSQWKPREVVTSSIRATLMVPFPLSHHREWWEMLSFTVPQLACICSCVSLEHKNHKQTTYLLSHNDIGKILWWNSLKMLVAFSRIAIQTRYVFLFCFWPSKCLIARSLNEYTPTWGAVKCSIGRLWLQK